MTQLLKATNKAWWSLSSSNPRTLLSSWPWTLHLDTQTSGLEAQTARAATRREHKKIQMKLLWWVVDIYVLQEFGPEAVVWMRSGQNFQHSPIIRTQEHHSTVLIGTGRNIHHYLSQFGPEKKKKKDARFLKYWIHFIDMHNQFSGKTFCVTNISIKMLHHLRVKLLQVEENVTFVKKMENIGASFVKNTFY